MPSRISQTFEALRSQDEKGMALFLTDGFPEPSVTLPLLQAMDAGGTDLIELGMPFSDPLAEGGPIQRASFQALQHGVTLEHTLETATQFRSRSDTPLLLMGYLNPIYQYGVSAFCQDARAAGVDGVIVADLPVEEAGILQQKAESAGLDLVFLVAPNTPEERVREIDRRASGFVYAVSVTGLTGSSIETQTVGNYLKRIRRLVKNNPLMVGFGIKSHSDAIELSRHTDGFIVGSELIRTIESLWKEDTLELVERLDRVQRFIRELKYGTPVSS